MSMEPDPADCFWAYPLQWGDTLSNQDWVPLYVHRLLSSDFVAHQLARGADGRAVIGTAFILWSESYRQDPAGTLPDDDVALARLAGFGADIAAWQALRLASLYGWQPIHIDGDDLRTKPRLGHRMVAIVAVDSFKRKAGRLQVATQASLNKARYNVRRKLVLMGKVALSEAPQQVAGIADWLQTQKLHCTEENIRAALEVVMGVPRIVRGN